MTVHHGWATFYNRGDSNPRLADGSEYSYASPMCAAPRGIPLGMMLMINYHGRSVHARVRDRSAKTIDLTPRRFRLLVGIHWRDMGKVRVTYVEEGEAAAKVVGGKGRHGKRTLRREAGLSNMRRADRRAAKRGQHSVAAT